MAEPYINVNPAEWSIGMWTGLTDGVSVSGTESLSWSTRGLRTLRFHVGIKLWSPCMWRRVLW